jgi:hypothetical protein
MTTRLPMPGLVSQRVVDALAEASGAVVPAKALCMTVYKDDSPRRQAALRNLLPQINAALAQYGYAVLGQKELGTKGYALRNVLMG